MSKVIYVLHQNGAPEHYKGLVYYCTENGQRVEFREFSIIRQLASSIKNRDFTKFKKVFVNFYFLIRLIAGKNYNVVLGIAPYDFLMVLFSSLAKKHNVFFHTSWPHWDKKRFDKRAFINIAGDRIFKAWELFLEQRCKGIFCVSGVVREQLLLAYNISVPMQIVYHSYNNHIFYRDKNVIHKKPFKFLYVGRLVPNKGIIALLSLLDNFLEHEFELGIVGSGVLQQEVEKYAEKYKNLKFYGRLNSYLLGDIYRQYDVFLLPSEKGKSGDWEELFGMALIEAMACGLVPIATNHVGPKEIINNNLYGYLIDDTSLQANLLTAVKTVMHTDQDNFNKMSFDAANEVSKYEESQIALLWGNLLSAKTKKNHDPQFIV
jgi:glycosyltransferase involved in cell wall biosynthesis